MATLKQKTAFNKVLENVSTGNPQTAGQILVSAGYKKISKQPSRIFNSIGFQKLLAQVDDMAVLKRITEILLDSDKRSSLTAADMLLKLKDRYPAGKLKLTAYKEELSNIEDDI